MNLASSASSFPEGIRFGSLIRWVVARIDSSEHLAHSSAAALAHCQRKRRSRSDNMTNRIALRYGCGCSPLPALAGAFLSCSTEAEADVGIISVDTVHNFLVCVRAVS